MNCESSAFKLSYLRGCIVSCWLTNCIANGGCYYLFNHTAEPKTAVGFVINAAVTAFILSLICAGFAVLTVDAKYKKGLVPAGTCTRNNSLVAYLFPRGKVGQVLACAVVVTVLFTLLSGGVVVLCGFAESGVPVLAGMCMHGILAGFMGLTNMYLMLLARGAAIEEDGVLSTPAPAKA